MKNYLHHEEEKKYKWYTRLIPASTRYSHYKTKWGRKTRTSICILRTLYTAMEMTMQTVGWPLCYTMTCVALLGERAAIASSSVCRSSALMLFSLSRHTNHIVQGQWVTNRPDTHWIRAVYCSRITKGNWGNLWLEHFQNWMRRFYEMVKSPPPKKKEKNPNFLTFLNVCKTSEIKKKMFFFKLQYSLPRADILTAAIKHTIKLA